MRLTLLLALLWLTTLIAAAVGITAVVDQPWAPLVSGCAGAAIANVGLWLGPQLIRAHLRRIRKE